MKSRHMRFGKNHPENTRTALDRKRAGRRARVVRSNVGSNATKLTETKSSTPTKGRFSVVILLFVFFLIWSGLTTNIEVSGDATKATSQATTVVTEHFRGINRIWWFSSPDNLQKKMQEDAPYVDSFTVRRTLLTRRVIVEVEARRPAARLRTQNRQFVISHDGVVLEESESYKELPLIYDESNVDTLELHKAYLPESLVRLILDTKKQLEVQETGFKLKEFVLVDNTREIQAHQAKGYFIKFNATTAAQRQVKDLKQALKKISPDGKKTLRYIDVRFSGKVYIR